MRTAESTQANKKIPLTYAFPTLVENANTFKNAYKMRKNVRIRKCLKTFQQKRSLGYMAVAIASSGSNIYVNMIAHILIIPGRHNFFVDGIVCKNHHEKRLQNVFVLFPYLG